MSWSVTGNVIPRTIIIIDEFQKLITNLNEDEKQTIQDLFIDILQRGRSAGIHFILATQTFQLSGKVVDENKEAFARWEAIEEFREEERH